MRDTSRIAGALVISVLAGCASVEKTSQKPADAGVLSALLDLPRVTDALVGGREARCKTAICWGSASNTWWGLEPLIDLPIGKSFTLSREDDVALGSFIDNHDLSFQFTAGMRLWLFEDFFSVGTYLSQPIFNADDKVRVPGSRFEQPAARVRRPYPGAVLGLFGDTMWVGFDYDQLRNGAGDDDRDLNYGRNAVVSETWTITVAVASFTTIRNGIGLAGDSTKDKKKEPAGVAAVAPVPAAPPPAAAAATSPAVAAPVAVSPSTPVLDAVPPP